MKDSYTFSRNAVLTFVIVLILVIVVATVGVVRHLDYMKKHCTTGGAGYSARD